MNSARDAIGASDLFGVFRRALLIQASWSFDRTQTVGFAYAIEPALRKLYPDQAEYDARLKVHLEYFNTQPYFASFILGAAVRLEEDRAAGRNREADVSGLKSALMAPLGALGDSFFWAGLKPFAAVSAVFLLIAGEWWAPILFLAVYNTCHVGLRMGMLFWGYASGGDAIALMARFRFTKTAMRLKALSLTLLGGILGMMPLWRPEFRTAFRVPAAAVLLSGLVFTLVLVAVIRRRGSPVILMLGLAALCLALAYGGVI